MNLLMENWRKYLREQQRCTNATVMAIAEHFGDEVDPSVCQGRGTTLQDVWVALREMGYKVTNDTMYRMKHSKGVLGKPIPLQDFIDDHPTGVYVVATRNHAMALIDGVLTDTAQMTNLKRARYQQSARVEKLAEEGRDWQKDSERITGHEQNKEAIIGDGGQINSEPYKKDPIKKRSKSAPPAG